MDKRKRWKGLVVFVPVIALALASLFVPGIGVNQYIFSAALLIISAIGCAEALLGFHEKKDDRIYVKKRDGTWRSVK